MLAGIVRQPVPKPVEERLRLCGDRIEAVIERVRAISRGLHPISLAHGGLAGAVEEVVEGIGRQVELDIPQERLPPRIELAMYYILNEALTNIIRHAQADAIHLRIGLTDGTVVGEVVDNGRGGATVTLGGGLHGIEDRVRALRGRFELTSPPGRGTRLTVTIPLIGATA